MPKNEGKIIKNKEIKSVSLSLLISGAVATLLNNSTQLVKMQYHKYNNLNSDVIIITIYRPALRHTRMRSPAGRRSQSHTIRQTVESL